MNQIIIGHCLEILKQLPDNSVHCCITSPPYFHVRDYMIPPVYWPEVSYSPMPGLPQITIPEQVENLGLEPDIWAFVGHLVAIFREVWRVLRPDGTCWINLGDSYITSPPGNNGKLNNLWDYKTNQARQGDGLYDRKQRRQLSHGEDMKAIYQKPKELKMKDLAGIPWRVAYALQADGWYLRSDCPWLKANSMPESAGDRPGKAHEYVFLLSKRKQYYYDIEAIRKPGKEHSGAAGTFARKNGKMIDCEIPGRAHVSHRPDREDRVPTGRNRRTNDWFMESLQSQIDYLTSIRDKGGLMLDEEGDPLALLVNPASYKKSHFATFSEKLITPMILASTSEYGCCSKCGAPYTRILEKEAMVIRRSARAEQMGEFGRTQSSGTMVKPPTSVTTGWRPTCQCDSGVSPAVVLDPFFGSGTTGQVAIKHRRNFIGIDANPTYAQELATERLNGVQIQML